MSKNIYLYLFVFTALIALYLGVMGNRTVTSLEEKLKMAEVDKAILDDSLQSVLMDNLELDYFGLKNNEDALTYMEEFNLEDPTRYISDKLLETNETEGDNPLIPYEGMGSPFKINKIKILNHRWIIADFSDGSYWGELILRYEIQPDLGVQFTLQDHLLYTRSR